MRMWLVGASGFLLTSVASAQTLEELRDAVRDVARSTRYPLFVAALLGLTDEAELSGGNFRIDGEPSTDLSLLNLPMRSKLELGESLPDLLVEGTVGYATARVDIGDVWSGSLPGLETRVVADYEAYGGFAGVGPLLPIGSRWDFAALAIGGVAYVDSDARYEGPGAPLSSVLLDGILFNWDATYAIYGGSLLLRNDGWQWGSVAVVPHLRYDLRRMDPIEVDDVSQDTESTVQWLVGRLGFEGPTGWTFRGRGVDWIGDVGVKVFDDDTADVLGFGEYLEVGAGLQWAGDELPSGVSKLKLTGAVFVGDDITGWTLGVSVDF